MKNKKENQLSDSQVNLIDFALAELEKTMQAVKQGKEPKISPKLAKMLHEVEKVSDKQKEMTSEEVNEFTENLAKKIGE